MNLERYDLLIRKKQKERLLQTTRKFTDSVQLEFKQRDVTPPRKPPWEGVRLISDTGKINDLNELKEHYEELAYHYQKLYDERDEFMEAFINEKLPPGEGKYALEYKDKLDEVGDSVYRRDGHVRIADDYSRPKLIEVYRYLRANNSNPDDFPPKTWHTKNKTTKAMLAQILTDDFGKDADEIAEILKPIDPVLRVKRDREVEE